MTTAIADAMIKAGVPDNRLQRTIQKCLADAGGVHPKAARLLFEILRKDEHVRDLAMVALLHTESPPPGAKRNGNA